MARGSCRCLEKLRIGTQLHVCMALTPDAIHLSPSLSAPDPTSDAGLAEGLAALESYKKKDPAKGLGIHHHHHLSVTAKLIGRGSCSCRALQGSWKRADHEAELFQSDSFEPFPGCDSVFAQGARVESRRAIGEHMGPVYVTYFLYTSDFFTQFTYINLAFSPAPDDTIANLYRVSPSPTCHSMQRLINRNKVIRDRWASHSKL